MQDTSFTMNVKLSKFIKTMYNYINMQTKCIYKTKHKQKKAKGTGKWCVLLYLTTMNIHCIENRTILYLPDVQMKQCISGRCGVLS